MTPLGRPPLDGNSGIVKSNARTRVFRATQRAICARSPRRINIAARAHRTGDNFAFRNLRAIAANVFPLRCRLSVYDTVLSYVKLVARMEAMTSPPIPSTGRRVDSSTDEVVLCLFLVRCNFL